MSSGQPPLDDLFAAAREDAPSSAVRDGAWGRVVTSTIAAAPPATAAGAAALAAKATVVPATTKLLALGAVIGAAGAAATIVAVSVASGGAGAPSAMTARASRTPAIVARGPTAGARLGDASPRPRAGLVPSASASSASALSPTSASATSGAPVDESSSLAEEARLVTEARTALVSGDPALALALAQRSHVLPVRALEPEELALEARALRGLGRHDEARIVEMTLRQRFPNHALSR